MAIPHYDQTILPCVQVGGYGFTQEKPMKFLGGAMHKYKPRITATFMFVSDANLLALADFYYNDLNSGTLPFTIVLPVEGMIGLTLNVKIVSDFNTSYTYKTMTEKSLVLELQDDITDLVTEAMVRQQTLGA